MPQPKAATKAYLQHQHFRTTNLIAYVLGNAKLLAGLFSLVHVLVMQTFSQDICVDLLLRVVRVEHHAVTPSPTPKHAQNPSLKIPSLTVLETHAK